MGTVSLSLDDQYESLLRDKAENQKRSLSKQVEYILDEYYDE